MVTRGRLLPHHQTPESGERFEPLADLGGTAIEQILSSSEPDSVVYDQSHEEWVLVLHGAATMDVEGETVELASGDWLVLPAHTRHQVVRTQAGTSWLAVHVKGGGPATPLPGRPGSPGTRRSPPGGP